MKISKRQLRLLIKEVFVKNILEKKRRKKRKKSKKKTKKLRSLPSLYPYFGYNRDDHSDFAGDMVDFGGGDGGGE